MTNIDDLANDIREVDGNNDLGAGALAEALVAKGWAKTPPAPPKALGDYRDGDKVWVLDPKKNEVIGTVNGVEARFRMVHVDTERGPVTIQNPALIRPA